MVGRALALLGALGVVGVLLAVGALAVAGSLLGRATPAATLALQPDAAVALERGRWLVLRPAGAPPRAGLIFSPGALVDPEAYAPTLRPLARAGYLVVILAPPFKLALLDQDQAASVRAAFPEVRAWALAGHSLGGVVAAGFARRNPGAVQALVLWASYPSDEDDLSRAALRVTSIYGTRDGRVPPERAEASRRLLPPTTDFVPIEGGNHAQFGSYTGQPGDLTATISAETQQRLVAEATRRALEQAGLRNGGLQPT